MHRRTINQRCIEVIKGIVNVKYLGFFRIRHNLLALNPRLD